MSPEESLRPAPGEVRAPEGDGGVVQGEEREAGPQPPHQHRAAHPLSPGVAQTDPDPAVVQHTDIYPGQYCAVLPDNLIQELSVLILSCLLRDDQVTVNDPTTFYRRALPITRKAYETDDKYDL